MFDLYQLSEEHLAVREAVRELDRTRLVADREERASDADARHRDAFPPATLAPVIISIASS